MAPKEFTVSRPDPPADFDAYEFFGIDQTDSTTDSTTSHITASQSPCARILKTPVEEEIQHFDKWKQWAKKNERMRNHKPLFRKNKQNNQKHDLLADQVDDCVALFMQFQVETLNRGIRRQNGQRGLLEPS